MVEMGKPWTWMIKIDGCMLLLLLHKHWRIEMNWCWTRLHSISPLFISPSHRSLYVCTIRRVVSAAALSSIARALGVNMPINYYSDILAFHRQQKRQTASAYDRQGRNAEKFECYWQLTTWELIACHFSITIIIAHVISNRYCERCC